MTEVASLHVASRAVIPWTGFTIVILQFKTGVKSTLTSQIKELGAINTFGNKTDLKYEPGLIQINDNEKHLESALMAMRMNLCLWGRRSWARCNNETKNWFSQELEKWEKKAG